MCAFLSKVSVKGKDECWEWQASKDVHGYGRFGWGGRAIYKANRVSVELFIGTLGDKYALHKCDNPGCVNPNHLFIGTKKENTQDMVAKGRWGNKIRTGSSNNKSILTESDIPTILKLRTQGQTYKQIGERYGVFASTIHQIFMGNTWREITRLPARRQKSRQGRNQPTDAQRSSNQ